MPSSSINGNIVPNEGNPYTGFTPIYSPTPGLYGRQAQDGQWLMGVHWVRLWAAGDGSSRQISLFCHVGAAARDTPRFWMGAAASAQDTGPISLASPLYIIGAQNFSADFGINKWSGGYLYYGRASGGPGVYEAGNLAWPGDSLAGQFGYSIPPAAPDLLEVTQVEPGKILVRFQGAPNDTGLNSTGWVLQFADNPSFSGADTIASSGTSYVNIPLGSTYYFRAAGRNALTDYLGRYGAWSNVGSVTGKGGGRRMTSSGSSVPLSVARRFSGSSWVDLSTRKRYSGSTWVDISN